MVITDNFHVKVRMYVFLSVIYFIMFLGMADVKRFAQLTTFIHIMVLCLINQQMC